MNGKNLMNFDKIYKKKQQQHGAVWVIVEDLQKSMLPSQAEYNKKQLCYTKWSNLRRKLLKVI